MPWAFGPILTAGVTLGAATVVVANPVVVPRADVQIPAAHVPVTVAGVGHHGSALDMLDEEFIRAVGPGPTASANPLAALTDLARVLVADAAQMGRTAILHAFATGTRVIADPVLTSTSYPYLPAAPSDPAALPWSGPTPPIADAGDLGPVVAQALTAVLADVGDVSEARAVVAAFAAGAALASEQLPVLDVVESVQRDLRGVLLDTASVVAALPRPREVIGDGIRTAVKVLPVIVPAPIAVPGFGDPPVPGFSDPPVPGFGDPPVPGFGDPPVPDTDAPVTDAPVSDSPADGSGASSDTDDLRVASPLADRRSGPVDDGRSEQAVEPVEPVADEEISVTDKPAGWSPSGLADALGLKQRAQRESGEAASPGIKQRAGRTAR
jgi:hypothetical protein